MRLPAFLVFFMRIPISADISERLDRDVESPSAILITECCRLADQEPDIFDAIEPDAKAKVQPCGVVPSDSEAFQNIS
jgi:hypothetical protein